MIENNVESKSYYPIDFAYAKGKHVYLRYLTEEDAKGEWHLWFNSPVITRYVGLRRWFNTVEDQLDYLRYLKSTKDRLALAIVDIKSNKHIGICSLGSIDYFSRNAEMSCIIGDESFHKGYYALEAMAMITEIGFTKLNLHKIYATGAENNRNGIKLTELLGFKKSGRYEKHTFIDGRYVDVIILEIFQEEWFKSKKRPKINS